MRLTLFLLACLFVGPAFAQKTYVQPPTAPKVTPQQLRLAPSAIEQLNQTENILSGPRRTALQQFGQFSITKQPNLAFPQSTKIVRDPYTNLPIYVEGALPVNHQLVTRNRTPIALALAFTDQYRQNLHIPEAETNFAVTQHKMDAQQIHHTRMIQTYRGLPVYGTEVIVHSQAGEVLLFNGRYYPTPKLQSVEPAISAEAAVQISREDLAQSTPLLDFNAELEALVGEASVSKQSLCIYFSDRAGQQAHLAYEIKTAANPLEKWTYLVDAQNGQILKKYNRVCTLHPHLHDSADHPEIDWSAYRLPKAPGSTALLNGPRTANATDLSGTVQTINTYELVDTFYLLDASRQMWTNIPEFPNDFRGGIYTATANNTNTNNFESSNIFSLNNGWNDPISVSAHHNAGVAYEYFRTTFGRNSIDGLGGNIISFVDVADEDGGGLDNAFWNGQFMFYGSGRQAFAPLAGALDVAGHEMSHGVVQGTANLEYQGESGALNESFADIFGAMIDRDDWLMGEDVVNRQVFPSGALRNMMDPNNGGFSLNDRGYQPAHVNEQYLGQEDNGGVHINSGITNRAFYLFATQVGKEVAEQVFYHALDNYLTRSSQFIDARLAVIRSAQENYGTQVANAAAAAFDQVGISDAPPTAPPAEATPNEGQQFLLMVGEDDFGLYIAGLDGNPIQGANPLVEETILFKPSISDDGGRILYINDNNQLRLVTIDWSTGNFNLVELQNDPVWRRAAISKDGLKAAVTTTDLDPTIVVFDLRTGSGSSFELFNPTTAQGGVNSGDVRYADGLEWDLSSQYVIYDAFNEVEGLFESYTYYDIGSLYAWDNQTDNLGDGDIEKLFATLPDDVSIGNPAISKNSPNILVFDFINFSTQETAVLAVDIETGATGTIANTNNLGFPNYSVADDYILYEEDGFFLGKVIQAIPLGGDKISANGQLIEVNSGYRYPNWFATGSRVISNIRERINPDQLGFEVMPNPSKSNVMISTDIEKAGTLQFEIYDLLGKQWYQHQTKVATGPQQVVLPTQQLPAGTYILKMRQGQSVTAQKIIKQ